MTDKYVMQDIKLEKTGHSLKQLEDKVEAEIRQFKKLKTSINDSDEPSLNNVEGQKEYLIAQNKDTLDRNVKKIDEAYRKMCRELIAEQEEKVAQSTEHIPSKTDSEFAQSIADDFAFSASLHSSDDAVLEEIAGIEKRISLLDDNKKRALRRYYPTMMSAVESKGDAVKRKMRTIGHKLADIKTEDEAVLEKMKEAERAGASTQYRVLLAAEKSILASQRGGSVDVDYKPL